VNAEPGSACNRQFAEKPPATSFSPTPLSVDSATPSVRCNRNSQAALRRFVPPAHHRPIKRYNPCQRRIAGTLIGYQAVGIKVEGEFHLLLRELQQKLVVVIVGKDSLSVIPYGDDVVPSPSISIFGFLIETRAYNSKPGLSEIANYTPDPDPAPRTGQYRSKPV
jgi:hypothetical protein